jgi:hypothetical protein
MKWSKLKKLAEELLAETLKKRVAYNLTRYGPGESYIMNRGWITFDKEEIMTCSTIKSDMESYKLTEIDCTDYKKISEQLHKQGIFTRHDFVSALEEYVSLKVNDALKSENPIIRAIGMFDRRLGKRKLKEIKLAVDEHKFVKKFYQIRCQVEREEIQKQDE